MKLHNKKTGEIKEGVEISIWLDHEGTLKFRSLAELNEEWEDNEPKEPLIKDEKVRKKLRNYAEMFNWKSARYSSVNNAFVNQGDMLFVRPSWELEQLEQLGYIPITELCGEEKE